MNGLLLRLIVFAQALRQAEGQDMVEYALVAALIALGATAGMSSLANAINTAFSAVGSTLNSYAT